MHGVVHALWPNNTVRPFAHLMPPLIQLSRRTAKAITIGILPLVVLPLVRMRIITEEHLKDPASLLEVFMKHFRKGTERMEWCVAIDETFLEQSIQSWRRGERFIAVVLYATAVEQYMNSMYQHILPTQGWTAKQITSFLREVSVDAKFSWMFEVFTKRRFPTALRKRLRTVFAIRNAIVHFKSELAHPDREEDSYSKIEAQLQSLRRMSISRDFRLLNEAFSEALFSCDPDRQTVMKATEMLLAAERKRA